MERAFLFHQSLHHFLDGSSSLAVKTELLLPVKVFPRSLPLLLVPLFSLSVRITILASFITVVL
jgi:hypothetical protein